MFTCQVVSLSSAVSVTLLSSITLTTRVSTTGERMGNILYSRGTVRLTLLDRIRAPEQFECAQDVTLHVPTRDVLDLCYVIRPRHLTYYARIILDVYMYLLFPVLCRHIPPRPTAHVCVLVSAMHLTAAQA